MQLAGGKVKSSRRIKRNSGRRLTYRPQFEQFEDRLVPTLQVTNFTPTATGFSVTFNEAFNPATVNLYTAGSLPDDAILTTSNNTQVSVRGSLLINAADTSITFVKTATAPSPATGSFDPGSGLLAANTYYVTLRSYSPLVGNGFQDLLGNPLNSTGGGNPGSNYVTSFSVSAPPVAVGIPDFARGPSNTDAITFKGFTNSSTFALTYTNPSASPTTGTATVTYSTTKATLLTNIQSALSSGGLATQIGQDTLNSNTPNSMVIVTTDTSTGANVLVTFQSALAQATNQLLTSTTPGVSISPATINLPNNIPGSGIPIALSSGQNVTSGSFTLQYNPSLLSIGGVVPSAAISSIAGATFTLSNTINNSTSATAVLSLSSPSNISTTSSAITLGSLAATVPMSAVSSYGAEQLLHFSSEQLNGTGGPIAVTNQDGVQVVAYFGDVAGQGQLNGTDTSLIQATVNAIASTVAPQTIPGFQIYPDLDPAIIGDVTSLGYVSQVSATAMNQEQVNPEMTIPQTPLGLAIPPIGSAAPVLTAPAANQNFTAGTSANVNLGTLSDSGPNDSPWTVTVNWGDSTANLVFTATTLGVLNQAHTYASAGTYSIGVTVTNAVGAAASASFSVGVAALPGVPIVTGPSATQTVISTGVPANLNLGSFSDTGTNDGPWTVTVNWGDSSSNSTFTTATQGGLSQAHMYISAGTYTMTVTVTNALGASASAIGSVAVALSGVPILTGPSGTQNVNAGVGANLNLGSFSDPVVNDGPWTVTVNWGDSSSISTFTTATQGGLSQAHTYANAGTYTMHVTVTNSAGASASATGSVAVVALTTGVPVLTMPSGTQTVSVGVSAVINLGSFSDLKDRDNPWTVTVNWGDSTTNSSFTTATQGPLSQAHTYANAGTYTITVTVTNAVGASVSANESVAVVVQTGVVTMSAPPANQIVNPGASASFNLGSFSDTGTNDGPWTVTVNWGDSTANSVFTVTTQGGLSQTHTYANAGTFTMTVTVTNAVSASASANGAVTVGTPTGQVTVTQPVNQTVNQGFTWVNLGSFTDAGTGDQPWTVTINWGDSTANSTFTTWTQGALGQQSHTYANAGSYTIGVTVTDFVGASSSASGSVTVVTPTATPTDVPVLSAPLANQIVNQGVSASVNLGMLSDPGANDGPWHITVNWGDSTANSMVTITTLGNFSLAHAYANAGTFDFTVTVTNAVGGSVSIGSFVTVVPPVPTVAASPGNQTINKGVSTNVNLGSFSDQGINDGPWNVTVNWGDSTANSTFAVTTLGGLTDAHAYANNGTYTIAVTVTNAFGASASASGSVTVVTPAVATDDTAPYIVTPYDKIPNFGAHPTVISVLSGAWSSASTWSTGVVPTTGAIVSIEPNTTVTYDTVSTAAVNTVIIQNGGQLIFRTDVNTTLTVVNLLVLQGGLLQVGTQATPVAASVKAQIVFADQPINTATDPSQYGNGLIALGTVTMYGAPMNQTWVPLAVEPHAGDTTLTLSQAVSGWQVGDKIILPDTNETNPNGETSDWELLTIASVSASGTVLTLTTPLQYNHLGGYDGNGVLDFLPDVGDLTRSVVVKSANPSGTRGYTLFTDRANVNIQDVQFGGLGRTTSSLADSTTYDALGNVTHIGTNELGRSAVNFDHLFGPVTTPADGYQFTFVGNSVSCPLNGMNFRWGIALQGSSYGLLQDNVLYNWFGAGIITIDGSESYNLIAQNFVVRIGGTGHRPIDTPPDNLGTQDLGTEGAAFWFAGPNNIISGNVAADVDLNGDANAYGYLFYIASNVPVPNFKGADTSVAGQFHIVNMEQTPLLGFTGNEVYGTYGGLTIWYLGATYTTIDPLIGQSVIEGLTEWNVNVGFFSYPMNNVLFDHWVLLGYEPYLGNADYSAGMTISDYLTANCVIDNSNIQGMLYGIQVPFKVGDVSATGQTPIPFVIENTYLRNCVNIMVETPQAVTGGNQWLPPRETIVSNVTFAQPTVSDGYPDYNIEMRYQPLSLATGGNFIQSDQVFVCNYNQVAGDDFQVYYTEQQANFIVPQTGAGGLAAPVAGLTNAQAWSLYGIASAGAVAPSEATTLALIAGLVGSI